LVIGLCQISWLPLPCRTGTQPAAPSKSHSGLSNCGAIHAAAGSASRRAVIWRNSEAGSTPGWLSGRRSSAIAEIFCPQFVERGCIGGGRNVIAVTAPNRGDLIPGGGNREDHRLRHISCTIAKPLESRTCGNPAVAFVTPPPPAPARPAQSARLPPSAAGSSRRGWRRHGESSTSPRRCLPG
jgi:hypothetical protein